MMTRTQIKNYIREEIIEILTPAEAEETADALAQAADSAERIEKALSEEKELTYNDFVGMARAEMMAGAAPDEYPSDKQVKNYADFLYGEYLKGVSVDDLFEVTLSEEKDDKPHEAKKPKIKVSVKYAREASDVFRDAYSKKGKMTSTNTFEFNNADDAEEFAEYLMDYIDIPEEVITGYNLDESVNEATYRRIDEKIRKSEDIVDVASKMTETAKEMKSLAKQYKAAEGEEKEDILKRLKELTKIKKELEGLI